MKVVFYQRKRPLNFFSLEIYFDNVRRHLPPDIQPVVAVSRYYSAGFFKRLYNIFEAAFRQGDVNHITGDVNYLALLMTKRKTILTIHDLGIVDHPSALSGKIIKLFWVTIPIKKAMAITAVSHTTKAEIVRRTGCDPAKVHVIHTCIGSHFRRVEKAFDKNKPVILQIGTAANKNCLRMAQALQGINSRLVIVGEPSPEHVQTLKECRIDYTTVSRLSDEEMLQQYINCDVLLFASTLEGFGMPIVEANTVGRVVVSSNISSMPEVARDAACLVDPFNVQSIREGVLRVIEDDDYRDELIERGFENARRFDVRVIAGQYAEVYRGVAG